jgi:type I restriction enzyme S subunit
MENNDQIDGTLPNHWKIVTINDLIEMKQANLQTGPFGTMLHASAYQSEGTPVVAVQHIGDNRLLHSNIPLVNYETRQRLIRYQLQVGDILFGRKGAIDRRALISIKEEGWLQGSDCIRLRLDAHVIDPTFVSYVLGSDSYREWITQHAQGATMPSLNQEILGRIPLPYPPLSEQRAIAGMLGALDDKIELNRRMNATIESIARSVFRQWFVDREADGNWEESSLEEIFGNKSDCVLTGPFGSHLHAHDYCDRGTPLILVKHVMDGHIVEDGLPLVGEHKLPDIKRYLLEIGDIVFTRVGAVGRSAYIHPRHKGWLISGQTLRVRVPDKKKLNPRFLAQIYLEPSFIVMVEQHALGTTRPSLNTSILLSFKFVLPPIEFQNKFAEFAEMLDILVQNNLDESRTLASLRDTLLPRLMRGEIRVKEL